jgi:hypothetical protein
VSIGSVCAGKLRSEVRKIQNSMMKLESFLGCLELELGGIVVGYLHLMWSWITVVVSAVFLVFWEYYSELVG